MSTRMPGQSDTESLPEDLSVEASYIGSRMSQDNNTNERTDVFEDNVDFVRPSTKRSSYSYYKGDMTLLESIRLESNRSKEDERGFEWKAMESSVEKFFRNAGTIALGPARRDSQEDSMKRAERLMEKEDDLSYGSKTTLEEFIESAIEQEFPVHEQIPSAMGLINVGELKSNRSLYSPGDWVEIQGFDMKWRLDMITRVIKQAPPTWNWNDPDNEGKEPKWKFTYNAGLQRNVDANDLRTPEAGLHLIFGKRPWVWQQYAVLKLEHKLRLQKGHQNDFMELDIQKYAADLWDQWLEHPDNADFKDLYYDDRIGEKGRLLLLNHITKPFRLIDIIGEDNHDWNFNDDDNINVFTYLGLFGSGTILPFLVLVVQLVIPFLLVWETNKMREMEGCAQGDELASEVIIAKFMATVVFTYYMFSIIPETYANFFNVAGAAETVYSRLLSIRRDLWFQSEDSILQMIGYKLDIYMNTSYETCLSMLNIYVLLNTDQAIELILNALAFAFIARIDEDLTKNYWYDPEKRWITAGAMSVVMQSTVKFRWLESAELFSKNFDIPEDILSKVTDDDISFLCNNHVAIRDAEDPAYMTNSEKIEMMCTSIAQKANNRNALNEYCKPTVYFGIIEKLTPFFHKNRAIFQRFTPYRTWSRWERVLYLSPVPDLDMIFDRDEHGNDVLSPSLANRNDLSHPIANFYPKEKERTEWQLFVKHIWDVLFFRDFRDAFWPAVRSGYYLSAALRLIDGIFFNWISYFIHILFPIYVTTALVETIYNVVTRQCFHPISTAYASVQNWILGG